MTKEEILRQIDEVIEAGPYKDNWESLCKVPVPEWYRNAKFGIFIHWGVYSVPAFENEWYPRNMYMKGSKAYEHHLKTYGPQEKFGYKDFIPMFKGERFDAGEWVSLIKESGAKFFMPVAEHHDGFQMYESALSKWNAKQMGPMRDVVGELKEAADDAGLVFALSNHRAEHCWFFRHGLEIPSDVADPANEDFYGPQEMNCDIETLDIYDNPPPKPHCEDWLARAAELVDKYRPRVIWFDWWIHNIGFRPYIKKFAAYYYNRAAEWGVDVAINYKYDAFARGAAVFDVERGLLKGIQGNFWQTDTAVARNTWCYTEDYDAKCPAGIVRDLIDTVSKNGCMLLNIGPKADGTISEADARVLRSIGKWMKQNGEGIYGTTFWDVFGEGPTEVPGGYFVDNEAIDYTSGDFRFTYKGGIIYAFVMKWPEDGKVSIKSLRRRWRLEKHSSDFGIEAVSLLGFGNEIAFERDETALRIQTEEKIETEYPVGIKIILS